MELIEEVKLETLDQINFDKTKFRLDNHYKQTL